MDEPDRDDLEPVEGVLSDEVISQVVMGLENVHSFKLHASTEQWGKLNSILTNYQQKASFYDGFLNKAQVSDYKRLQTQAGQLLKTILGYHEAGHGKLIEVDLRGVGDLDLLIDLLTRIRDAEVSSPKLKENPKHSWEDYLKREAGYLQVCIDSWWAEVTGALPKEFEEGDSPYSLFLNSVLPMLASPGKSMGGSRAATAARRRDYKKHGKMLKKY